MSEIGPVSFGSSRLPTRVCLQRKGVEGCEDIDVGEIDSDLRRPEVAVENHIQAGKLRERFVGGAALLGHHERDRAGEFRLESVANTCLSAAKRRRGLRRYRRR